MKRKILSIVVLILFLLSYNVCADQEDSISWNKAVVKLDKNNNTLISMIDSENQSKKQYDDAVKKSEKIETDGILIEIMGYTKFIKFNTYTQMLLTQQKELLPEQMKLSWEINRSSRAITRNSMIIGLRGLYLGLYSADSNIKLEQKKYELAEKIYQQQKIKYQRELISDLEYAEAEYNLSVAESALVASQRNYENMLRSFNTYIGLEPNTAYDEVIFDEEYNDTRLKEPDYYVKRAFETRLDIFSAEKMLSLDEHKKAIFDRFPYSMNTESVKRDYEDLVLDIETRQMQLESLKLEVEKGIRSAYVEVVAAGKNVVSMKKKLELQADSLKNTNELYKAGLISKNVLDQAEISYIVFENSYRSVLFDYNTRQIKLEYASGLGPAYQEG